MGKQPLVSIGLPTYNRADDLKACLANLTSLDYKNIEIIISDNHSTDATTEVCKEYVKKDRRIQYYRQKTNSRVYKNSIFVLEKAKGKYFFLASDDDIRSKTYLSELIPELERNPQATIAITGTKLFTKHRSYSIPVFFLSLNHPISSIITYLIHPECVSILLYGVHRRTQLFIDNFKRVMGEKRPFGVLGYDDSLAVFLLLQGDLIYRPKTLFFIRDNGMYLSVYKNLSGANLSKIFFQKTARYMMFPVMFLCDWYYGSLHVCRSSLPFYLKPLILLCVLLKLFFDLILYILSILKGLSLLLSGMLHKILLFLFHGVPFSENK